MPVARLKTARGRFSGVIERLLGGVIKSRHGKSLYHSSG
jgi:hypothetical protein